MPGKYLSQKNLSSKSCRKCSLPLQANVNWSAYCVRKGSYICNKCRAAQVKDCYLRKHPERAEDFHIEDLRGCSKTATIYDPGVYRLTDEQATTLATVLDCEGYIGIIPVGKNKDGSLRYSPVVSVGMTVPLYPESLHIHFGGTLRKRQGRNRGWKPQYDWRVSNQKAANCLCQLTKYIRIKKEQAALCTQLANLLDLKNHNSSFWDPIEGQQLLDKYYQRCKELNARGSKYGE